MCTGDDHLPPFAVKKINIHQPLPKFKFTVKHRTDNTLLSELTKLDGNAASRQGHPPQPATDRQR